MHLQASGEMPLVAQDLINYTFDCLGAHHQIHCVFTLNGFIDEQLLRRAVWLLLVSEPVLGRQLVADLDKPYWKSRENWDGIEPCSFISTDDTAAELQRYINTAIDDYRETQLQVRILRSKQQDTVCVKVNHACCDAGGLKECVSILTSIYQQLMHDRNYAVAPNPGRRDQTQLWENINVYDMWQSADSLSQFCGEPCLFPVTNYANNKTDYVLRQVRGGQLANLLAYARRQGVTVNDLLLTACYRALFLMNKTQALNPQTFRVTVDLRQYLPDRRAAAICNLSSIVYPAIRYAEGEKFTATLHKVTQAMKFLKEQKSGLISALLFEVYSRLGYEQVIRWMCAGQSEPLPLVLSNIGVISKEAVCFGDCTAIDGYMIGPALLTPGFLIAVSTYRDALTVAMAYFEPAVTQNQIERYLDLLVAEILGIEETAPKSCDV